MNQLAAAREERFQIGIHRVDVPLLERLDLGPVAVEVERLEIPARIVEHHELKHLLPDRERLRAAERGPPDLTSALEAGKDLLAGFRIDHGLVHRARRLDLRRSEAARLVTGLACRERSRA